MQRLQACLQISAQMNSQSATIPRAQHLKISASLCCFHHAKRVLLAGDFEVLRVVTGDLQKDSGVWSAFVSLSGGMQEARTKSQAGGRLFAIPKQMTGLLQRLLVGIAHWNVREQRKII